MANFESSKNGYDKKQVDEYISKLEHELDVKKQLISTLDNQVKIYIKRDNDVKSKNENISIALTAAVEKARQIEKSSQNVYKLKIQQIGLLYSRWEKLLNNLVDKYPQIEQTENVKGLLREFKESLKSTLKDDFKINTLTSPVRTENDTIRLLLGKLSSHGVGLDGADKIKEIKVERKQLSKDILEGQSELNRLEEKSPIIKPIYNQKIENGEVYENLADKFLTESIGENNAYASIITSKVRAIPKVNETGFDLKEAINPKEDLDEIMKAFDFFLEEDEDK